MIEVIIESVVELNKVCGFQTTHDLCAPFTIEIDGFGSPSVLFLSNAVWYTSKQGRALAEERGEKQEELTKESLKTILVSRAKEITTASLDKLSKI